MSELTIDTETTTKNKGDPFNPSNKLCTVGMLKGQEDYEDFKVEYDSEPYGRVLESIQDNVTRASLLVLFNAKFDLHWLRRYRINFCDKRIWDCQLVHFILNYQKVPYPALNDVAASHGLGQKIDVIKLEYWDRRCSCCAGVVEKLKFFMLKEFVEHATIDNMENLDLVEQMKKENGERIIQKSMKLLKKGEVRNYVLILKQRLEQNEQSVKIHTISQMKSMIDSWLLLSAQYVEDQRECVLTTTISQEKLEGDCVGLVMQLWDMLKKEIGWKQHSITCSPVPVDTPDIPLDTLLEYQKQDVTLTHQIYQKQLALVEERGIKPLCLLHNMDLLMLEEMEWNGMKYDSTASIKEGDKVEKQIEELDAGVKRYWPELPINLSSPDHISAILYGGTIRWKEREEFLFTYKDAKKEPVWKSKIVEKEAIVERQVDPLKGSESKKEGNYSTDEDTLRSLRAKGTAKKIIASLLERRGLEKLRGTYLHGIPKKIVEAEWEDSLLHGNLNQCRVITGRLSSDKPNMQNMDKLVKKFFRSR